MARIVSLPVASPAATDGPCGAMGEIIDSRFFGDGFGTQESREVFCDLRRLQRWLDAALAHPSVTRASCLRRRPWLVQPSSCSLMRSFVKKRRMSTLSD